MKRSQLSPSVLAAIEHPSAPSAKPPQVIVLPWPPTINTYYRVADGRTLISSEGREYRKTVRKALLAARIFTAYGRLRLHIEAMPPDHRPRDLDNLLKSLLDALEHAGLFDDDEQIDDLRIVRGAVEKPGMVRVVVQEIDGRP